MELNDKQRGVLQAILDGKKVMGRYIYKDYKWQEFDFHMFPCLGDIDSGDNDFEVKILEKPIRVALFKFENGTFPFREAPHLHSDCRRVSDWVEIEPNE